MTVAQLQQLLDQVRDGQVAPEAALDQVMALLRATPLRISGSPGWTITGSGARDFRK